MRMRSISVVCLAVALTMGLTSSAFALEGPGTEVPEAVSPEQETTEAVSEEQAAPEYSPTERKEILEEQENVVEELMAGENLTDMTQRELDQTIQEVLKEDEIPLVKEYLLKRGTIRDLGVLLELQTGVRVGELSTLKHSDWVDDRLKIRRTEVKFRDGSCGSV